MVFRHLAAGESLRTRVLQSVMDSPVLKTGFAVLLFVKLWFPMPLSALSFYVTDWLSGVSPLSSLWWLACGSGVAEWRGTVVHAQARETTAFGSSAAALI